MCKFYRTIIITVLFFTEMCSQCYFFFPETISTFDYFFRYSEKIDYVMRIILSYEYNCAVYFYSKAVMI